MTSPALNKLAIAAGVIAGFAGALLTMFAAMIAGGIVQGVQGRAPDENTVNNWFQDPAALLTLQGPTPPAMGGPEGPYYIRTASSEPRTTDPPSRFALRRGRQR